MQVYHTCRCFIALNLSYRVVDPFSALYERLDCSGAPSCLHSESLEIQAIDAHPSLFIVYGNYRVWSHRDSHCFNWFPDIILYEYVVDCCVIDVDIT
jgi:hypothetical protein